MLLTAVRMLPLRAVPPPSDYFNAQQRVIATLVVFAAMLTLVIVRPGRSNEAWWTVLGGGAMLALHLVSWPEAVRAALAGQSALWFLLALLLLSFFVGKSGFFEWAALKSARVARGEGLALYRNTFILGALVTAVLSLDTTAVILTPVVVALVKRLKLPAAPYVILCAFVSNLGSLLLPVSNLTNILFASAFQLTFSAFAWRMLLPQVLALSITYALLRGSFRRALSGSFDTNSLPEPGSVIPHRSYFLACVIVLTVVLGGYFIAPWFRLEPYLVAFAGSFVLLPIGLRTGRVRLAALTEISWGVFPFVVGLFVAVRGVENLGIVELGATWLAKFKPGSLAQLMAAAGVTSLAANVTNNLPAALLARSVLLSGHAPTPTALAALVGANAGSIITPFGSLATMLVLTIARREGVEVHTGRIMLLAAWIAPVVVVCVLLAL